MAQVTVSQFAEVLKVPVDKLLTQLDEAGIKVGSADDIISDEAKLELLTHLRQAHGRESDAAAPRKITLQRKSQQEIKLASTQGRARTVAVEVRRKKTYLNRTVLEEEARHRQEEVDRVKNAEDSARLEAERHETEKREAEMRERDRVEAEARRKADEESRAQAELAERSAAEVQARERAERERLEAERRATEPPRVVKPRVVEAPVENKGGAHEVRAAGTARFGRRQRALQEEAVTEPLPPLAAGQRGLAPRLRVAHRPGQARRADPRDDHRRRAGEPHGGQGQRSHQDDDEDGRDGHHQPADRPGYRAARGGGVRPHPGAAERERPRGPVAVAAQAK